MKRLSKPKSLLTEATTDYANFNNETKSMTQNLQNQNHSIGGMQWSRTLWLGNYGEARVNARPRVKKRTHWKRTKGDADYKHTWRE